MKGVASTIGSGHEGSRDFERAGLANSDRARSGEIPTRRRIGVAWALGGLLLVVFVAVAAHHAEGRRLAELLRSARPAWLGAAAALQVATYACAAAVWQPALRRNGGVRRSVHSLVPLGLAKLFADQAVPSAGVSGTLLVVRGLHRRGVPRGLAIAAMASRPRELGRGIRARGRRRARAPLVPRRTEPRGSSRSAWRSCCWRPALRSPSSRCAAANEVCRAGATCQVFNPGTTTRRDSRRAPGARPRGPSRRRVHTR